MNFQPLLLIIGNAVTQIGAWVGPHALTFLWALLAGGFVLAIVAMCLGYRVVMAGMKTGKEQRLGTWYTWRK